MKSVATKKSVSVKTTKVVSTTTSVKKVTKSGRKGKKEWRKNVDISAVEEELHELRTEERLGGKAIHQADDQSLFFTDKAGDAEIKEKFKYAKLRIDDIITPKSGFDGITSRPTVAKSTKTVAEPGMKVRQASKNQLKKVQALAKRKAELGMDKVGAAQAAKAKRLAEKEKKLAQSQGQLDLWGSEAPKAIPTPPSSTPTTPQSIKTSTSPQQPPSIPQNDFISDILAVPARKGPQPRKAVSAIPAVQIVHAGASYNPSFTDHQQALRLAVDEELMKEDQRQAAKSKLAYPAELDNLDDETFFSESEDEEEESELKDGEGSGTQAENDSISGPQPTGTRKTKAQRNRERRLEGIARQEEQTRTTKKLLKQINSLGEIEKSVRKEERMLAGLANERQEKEETRLAKEAGRLGPHMIKPLPMDVSLTEDLPDTLRELRPEGNLFRERFQSLQKRSLIEARVPVGKKLKYRRKETETHDYKRFK
ncbi:ribosome biogenesis protein Nop53/GLTSCR2 [Phlyctochytrium arcticum]|nr:ribosome biogenesis protein Nop53/GLTSCR2 [Phlyctochytrium arcticum]